MRDIWHKTVCIILQVQPSASSPLCADNTVQLASQLPVQWKGVLFHHDMKTAAAPNIPNLSLIPVFGLSASPSLPWHQMFT